MVGVGSGSALNAFNIGQASTGGTAVGQAINSIVEQGDKLALTQGQSGAQTAGSLATAQFKNQLGQQPQDILVQNPDGSFTKIAGSPGGKDSILGLPQQSSIGQATGSIVNKAQGVPDRPPVIDFGTGQPPAAATPPGRVDPNAGGAVNINDIDPNRELTPEEEAAFRLQFNLPPRQ